MYILYSSAYNLHIKQHIRYVGTAVFRLVHIWSLFSRIYFGYDVKLLLNRTKYAQRLFKNKNVRLKSNIQYKLCQFHTAQLHRTNRRNHIRGAERLCNKPEWWFRFIHCQRRGQTDCIVSDKSSWCWWKTEAIRTGRPTFPNKNSSLSVPFIRIHTR